MHNRAHPKTSSLCMRCVAVTTLYRCVTVTGYTKGKVAAGLAVVVSLEVLARRQGAVREVVRIVAEDGVAEMVVVGEVSSWPCNTRRNQRRFCCCSSTERLRVSVALSHRSERFPSPEPPSPTHHLHVVSAQRRYLQACTYMSGFASWDIGRRC